MIRPSTGVRTATPDEMPRAVAAIVAAFITDPLARFALPDPHDYLRVLPSAIRWVRGRELRARYGLRIRRLLRRGALAASRRPSERRGARAGLP